MSFKEILLSGVIACIIGFLTCALVTFLWDGSVNWATSVGLGVSIGVALPIALTVTRKKS